MRRVSGLRWRRVLAAIFLDWPTAATREMKAAGIRNKVRIIRREDWTPVVTAQQQHHESFENESEGLDMTEMDTEWTGHLHKEGNAQSFIHEAVCVT